MDFIKKMIDEVARGKDPLEMLSIDEVAPMGRAGIESGNFPSMFYIVINPIPESTFEDICYKTDILKLMEEAAGGLDPERIHLVTTDRREAENHANYLLKRKQEKK